MNKLPILLGVALATATSVHAQWNQLSPATSPSARSGAALTFDGNLQQMVLFGGAAGFSFASDTWAYDGDNWAQINTANSPAGRSDAGMVYDDARGVMLLYGGNIGGGPWGGPADDTTWTFDGADWTQLSPATTPGGRALHGMAFDSSRGVTVIYGGLDNLAFPIALADTFEFDGTNWTQVTTAASPGPREKPAMCYDSVNNRVLLFGGIDPQVGGFADTWAYDGTNWTRLNTQGSPAPRSRAEMVFDSARGVAVLHSGNNPTTGTIFDETWEFDGTTWTLVATGADVPSSRQLYAMGYDPSRGNTMVFGGVDAFFGDYDDTWEDGASFHSYGAGCSGSLSSPVISSPTGPVQGAPFRIDVNGLDPVGGFAWVIYGFTPGTVDLTSIGMPGCAVLSTNFEIFSATVSGGSATISFPVPTDPALFGGLLYCQALTTDATANSLGFALSAGAEAFIGH